MEADVEKVQRHSVELRAIRNEVHRLQATFEALRAAEGRSLAHVSGGCEGASTVDGSRLRTELESIQAGIDDVIRRIGELGARRKAIVAQNATGTAG